MKYIGLFLFCCLSFQVYAQNQEIVKAFDTVINSSNSWNKFKVVKEAKLASFREELIFTSDSLESNIATLESSISNYKKEIEALEESNNALNKELENLKNAKDEINIIGFKISKPNYQITVWSIILVLLLALILVFIKYRNRNIVTQELKENLSDTNKEFEEYKHRSIEKQQKLGRELLDAQKAAQPRNNKK